MHQYALNFDLLCPLPSVESLEKMDERLVLVAKFPLLTVLLSPSIYQGIIDGMPERAPQYI